MHKNSIIKHSILSESDNRKLQFEFILFRHYPITCHFRNIKTLGYTEPAGIVGVNF